MQPRIHETFLDEERSKAGICDESTPVQYIYMAGIKEEYRRRNIGGVEAVGFGI